ncbi:MAG: hypothetical protein N3B21_15240 [Clostridia bacterium]|nr:hypothetical protein [Clostridia bacterium]
MSKDSFSLAMISHGTDGTDGLEQGIHLRVSIDQKKGIPASGFRIYRRFSYGTDRGEALINFASGGNFIPLPHEVKFTVGAGSYSAVISSETSKQLETRMIGWNGFNKPYAKLEGAYKVRFSVPVNKIILDCFYDDGGDAMVTALYKGKVVETRQYNDINGQMDLKIRAHMVDELVIYGQQRFYLGDIGLYIWEDDNKGWKGPINSKYGLGFPLGTTVKALFDIAKKNGELPPTIRPTYTAFLRYMKGKDPDWFLAQMRLPKKLRNNFKESDFKELKEIMASVMNQKPGLPVDASKYEASEDNVDGSGIRSSMSMSPLSLLLLSSIHPDIARILGFYWTDLEVLLGNFYDYKVEADYPEGQLFNLGKYVDFSCFDGPLKDNFFSIEDIIFDLASLPFMSSEESKSMRLKGGIGFRLASPSIIRFGSVVREFQMFVKHSASALLVEGYSNDRVVASTKLSSKEGVISLHSELPLDYIKITPSIILKPPKKIIGVPGEILGPERDIIKSKEALLERQKLLKCSITIFKIATATDYLGFGTSSFIVKGVSIGKRELPKAPEGLETSVQKGMAGKGPSGNSMDKHYSINLTWNLPTPNDENITAYAINRQNPGGILEEATFDGLHLAVAEKDGSRKTCFQDIRMYSGRYIYSVQAVDIWGRRSSFSTGSEALCERFLPPPPYVLEAKLLEPGDKSLSSVEMSEIKEVNIYNGMTDEKLYEPILKVVYSWDQALDSQGIDVNSFNFYFQGGWQNVLMGKVTGTVISGSIYGSRATLYTDLAMENVTGNGFLNGESLRTEDGDYVITNSLKNDRDEIVIDFDLPSPYGKGYVTVASGTFQIASSDDKNDKYEVIFAIPSDVLEVKIGEKVAIGGREYPVLKESFIENSEGNFAVIELEKLYPKYGSHFTIPMKPGLPVAKDYSISSNWDLKLMTIPKNGYGIITRYFFKPPIKATLQDRITYAQVGVSSVNSQGEGFLSKALPIMSVYRDKPLPAEIKDVANQYATLPDFYGKCSFQIRWKRDNAAKYIIYRALDDAIFMEDSKRRKIKLPFTDGNGVFNEAEIDEFINKLEVIKDLGISPAEASDLITEVKVKVIKAPDIDYYGLFEEAYTNVFLKVLANIPGNEAAFARLNEKEINPDDTNYANKRAYWEAPDTPLDLNFMQYIDSTIDGGADNSYFYRIRTVNESGVLGDFSIASYAVRIFNPKLTGSPEITSIVQGDREALISFRTLIDKAVKGYIVYRTDDEEAAKDIRLMVPVLKPGKSISVAHPNDSLADSELEPDKLFYYRVVAVGEKKYKDDTYKVYSRPSNIVTAKVYEDQRPEAPLWQTPAALGNGNAIRLSWEAGSNLNKWLIQRRENVQGADDEAGWATITSWISIDVPSFSDENRELGKLYDYRMRVMDINGRQNKSFNILRGV